MTTPPPQQVDSQDSPPTVRVEDSVGVQAGTGNHQTINVYQATSEPNWPVRVGALPLPADCYQDRDIAFAVEKGLENAGTVVLTSPTTVVEGMGGVGKTQIAARHIRPLWENRAVDLAVWITADDRDPIITGYADAAHRAGQTSEEDPTKAARALLNWLSTTNRQWVIVLDDLQDPDHVKGWWPPNTTTGHTVVTTRCRDAALQHSERTIIEVTPYAEAESLSYLHAKLADRTELLDGAVALADELGHLPLALAQAVAYLLDEEITCEDYRHRFLTGRDVTPGRLPDDHQRTVDRTWELSIDRADQRKPVGLARPLLELLSLLDPNGIPVALTTSMAVTSYLADRIGRPITSDDVERAVRCLHRLSLATHDPAQPERGVRVHALVQHATRAKIAAGDEAAIAAAAADALVEVWPENDRDSDLARSLRANTAQLEHHASNHLWSSDGHAVLFHPGHSLGEAGLVDAARSYFQHLHETAEDRLGKDHPHTFGARIAHTRWRGQSGDVVGAVEELELVLVEAERALGGIHQLTLSARSNLARWRAALGDVADAVDEHKLLVFSSDLLSGPDHRDTLTNRNNLAEMRRKDGDLRGAVKDLEQLLGDAERVLDPDDPLTLTIRTNLAYCRGEGGDPNGAVAEFQRLLAERLRVRGADHPQTLNTRHNLAKWRGESGDVRGALDEYERLLPDVRRVLGADHPETLTIRHNLANWRFMNGDVQRAMAEFDQLLTDSTRLLGATDPSTLATRDNLALLRELMARPGEPRTQLHGHRQRNPQRRKGRGHRRR